MTLASASPERLVSLDARTRLVETRPIKGTRRRGLTPTRDRSLAAELAASEKDRAENVMIVDMSRNDLGRVSTYGSVHVASLWQIEQHPNVFQMVSTIRGFLDASKGPADLLKAVFPGASVTGAPKIRAMEIIDELEPTTRGIYTGSVGYIDFRGGMDLNIVIRSLLLRDGQAYFHGGGGVVADSVPHDEYQETLDKVSGLAAALALCQSGEELDQVGSARLR
jgi:para-aminobenzoate synthetase